MYNELCRKIADRWGGEGFWRQQLAERFEFMSDEGHTYTVQLAPWNGHVNHPKRNLARVEVRCEADGSHWFVYADGSFLLEASSEWGQL